MESMANEAAVIDIAQLLQAVSEEEPCGPDLEYDPDYMELERAVKGKPEVEYGKEVMAATPSDWKLALQLALQLTRRSRDLRIAVVLCRALLKQHGWSAYAAGLGLIEGLLAQRWDSVHPQLDPDDGNDPLSRVNALAVLAGGTMMLRDVREAPLVAARSHGRISMRDIDIANGEQAPADGETAVSASSVTGAFMECGTDELRAVHAALASACASSVAIEQLLTEKVGASSALDLEALTKSLARMRDYTHERLQARGVQVGAAPAADGAAAADAADAAAGAAGAAPAAAGGAPSAVRIGSRDDVVLLLEKICEFYHAQEPSSPIPLLLQRVQRLATKNFIELLQDLAPDGLQQFYQSSGANPNS